MFLLYQTVFIMSNSYLQNLWN